VAQEFAVAVVEGGSLGCVVCVVFFPLICIVVVLVPFVCCSVKLPLSRPTSFCLFSSHSPLHPGGERGSRVALLLLAVPNYNSHAPI